MYLKKSLRFAVAIIPAMLWLGGCATSGGYKPVADKLPELKVSFADPAWTGNVIPAGQQCQVCGGKGATPVLKVENIPAGANAIIVEYNDLNSRSLSSNGGHGKIGFWIKKDSASVTLPSVPGETAQLGTDGSFVEAEARSTQQYASPGYLPPCSGGSGHVYVADVKAVYKAIREGEENRLLAQQRIKLGTY
jgi:hypothetical protein